MVYDGIIIALIVGLIRGGPLKGLTALSQLKLIAGWIFPVLLVVQFIIFYLQGNNELISRYSGYLFIVIYAVGLAFLWLNRREPGFKLILLGVFLNFLVMTLNGGKMPVSIEAAAVLDPMYVEMLKEGTTNTKHIMLMESTRLPFLGDIIPLTNPYPREQVISIGDIVMNIGIYIFIYSVMVTRKKEAQHNTISNPS